MAYPAQTDSALKFLVFGAGAIGAYYGGSLLLAGQQATFVEQPKTAERLREHGLRLDLTLDRRRNVKEAYVIDPRAFTVAASLEDALKFGPFDAAIFALKSFDTPAALESMKPFAEKMPPILCLSNGVDNERMIAEALGEDKVIYGTVTSAIGRRAPGDVKLDKLRGTGIAAGSPLSERLARIFNAAYLNCRLYPEARGMKWSKMLLNLTANPASAILNMTAAEIFSDPRLYRVEVAVLRECLAVMEAQNIPVVDLPGVPVKAFELAVRAPHWLSKPFVARAAGAGRGAKMPSFHIDLHSGRGKSEVEYLHGAVVRAGKQSGVPTPVNETLTNLLLALTRGEIPLEEYDHQPEKFLSQIPL